MQVLEYLVINKLLKDVVNGNISSIFCFILFLCLYLKYLIYFQMSLDISAFSYLLDTNC